MFWASNGRGEGRFLFGNDIFDRQVEKDGPEKNASQTYQLVALDKSIFLEKIADHGSMQNRIAFSPIVISPRDSPTDNPQIKSG